MSIANHKFVPSWPAERDLDCYEDFIGTSLDLVFKNGATWIDIGCRSGKALVDSKNRFSSTTLVGVNAHPAKVRKGFEIVLFSPSALIKI